jgi:hypothetical protein
MLKAILLIPKTVNNTIYPEGTIFPNQNVPDMPPCMQKYIDHKWAQWIEEDKPVEVPVEIAEVVGKVELPPLPPEEPKVEKPKTYEQMLKEEKKERKIESNYKPMKKKDK